MIFLSDIDFTIEQIARVENRQYDVIIAGGGTSGLVAAITMIERGKTVCLVEAGPCSMFTNLSNTEARFQPEIGRSIRRIHQYSQKMAAGREFGPSLSCLGGRGMFWTGAAPRFNPHDFDEWPLSYNELVPHYEWIEREFRVAPFITDLGNKIIQSLKDGLSQYAIHAPFAFNDTKMSGAMLPSGISSALSIFLRNTTGQQRKDAIDILPKSFATEIVLKGNRPEGVKAVLNAKHSVTLRGNHVIVACGGIESARLLAHSKTPDPHKRIGAGIQEHLFLRTFWNAKDLYPQDKPDSAAVFIPSKSQSSEQVEIHMPGDALYATDTEVKWAPYNEPRYEVMMRSFAATQKTDANSATFSEKVLGSSLGSSIVAFSHSPSDEMMKNQMKERLYLIGQSLNMTLVRENFASFGGSYHEAGGLDMGDNEKTSVTDKNGRVHTLEKVYVVDASAFPKIGATNPHLTISAISRKQSLQIPF